MGLPPAHRAPDQLPEQAWMRLPHETSLAYWHFAKYREMPQPVRSIRRLAEELERKPDHMFKWSQQWAWAERVKAWDDYCDEQSRLEQVEEVRRIGVLRVQGAVAAGELFLDRVRGNDEKGIKAIDANLLDAKDLAAVGNVFGKLASQAEEAAGVKPPDEMNVTIKLAPGILEPSVAGEGHRVVEGTARRAVDARRELPHGEDDEGESDAPESD